MSRSFIHIRRVLFGVSCTIVFGFGATHAFAERTSQYCEYGTPWADATCQADCTATGSNFGWCEETSQCKCSEQPKGHVVVIEA